jgi:dihydroorotase
MSFLLKSATIVDQHSTHHLSKKDILINDQGIIEKIGSIQKADAKVISSDNLMVSPGWFDLRANFCDPGYEYKEDLFNGLKLAAASGFTAVVPVPNTKPVIQNKNDINYLQRFNGQQTVKVYPSGAVTIDCKGSDLTEMLDMYHAGALVFTDGHMPIWNTDILVKTLMYLQKTGGLLINRPEDKHLTAFASMHEGEQSTVLGMKGMPSLSEEIMIIRDLNLLDYAGGRIHFSTISTEKAVKIIKKAKKKGTKVSCDVAAYQLVFDDSLLHDYDTNYKVNPPLREKSDQRNR